MRIKTHPGEILNEEFLIPLGISSHYLSKQLNLSPSRIAEIIKGKRGITANTAIRLARFLGTSSQFWLNLQTEYDISKELQHNINEFNKIVAYSGKE